MSQKPSRYQQAKRITLLGALANAFLGILKIIGGFLYHSHALIADGLHSISDLMIDAMVLFASKYGSQEADDTHPYGHQRIETAGTLMLALLLIFAGVGIAWDAAAELFIQNPEQPTWLALPIAALSVLINEILFFYTRHVGHQIQSALITANAWHHRSDSAASAVVALGLIGSLLGFTHFDAIAAIIVGMMIVKMGLSYGWNSVKELIDTAIGPEQLQEIEQFISQIDGVKKIHQLRTRSMGGDIIIDVHVLVEPFISVSEGHYIAQHVHYLLKKQLPKVKDVTVHVDPEDDELYCPSVRLPNRTQLEKEIVHQWQKQFPGIINWTLHYLDGKIFIDLVYDPELVQANDLKKKIEQDLANVTTIKEVRLLSRHDVVVNKAAPPVQTLRTDEKKNVRGNNRA